MYIIYAHNIIIAYQVCKNADKKNSHLIYEATRVTATMKEMENFCNRYVKTLRLKVNSEGKFEIEIQK